MGDTLNQNTACILIQKVVRGHIGRKEVARLQLLKERTRLRSKAHKQGSNVKKASDIDKKPSDLHSTSISSSKPTAERTSSNTENDPIFHFEDSLNLDKHHEIPTTNYSVFDDLYNQANQLHSEGAIASNVNLKNMLDEIDRKHNTQSIHPIPNTSSNKLNESNNNNLSSVTQQLSTNVSNKPHDKKMITSSPKNSTHISNNNNNDTNRNTNHSKTITGGIHQKPSTYPTVADLLRLANATSSNGTGISGSGSGNGDSQYKGDKNPVVKSTNNTSKAQTSSYSSSSTSNGLPPRSDSRQKSRTTNTTATVSNITPRKDTDNSDMASVRSGYSNKIAKYNNNNNSNNDSNSGNKVKKPPSSSSSSQKVSSNKDSYSNHYKNDPNYNTNNNTSYRDGDDENENKEEEDQAVLQSFLAQPILTQNVQYQAPYTHISHINSNAIPPAFRGKNNDVITKTYIQKFVQNKPSKRQIVIQKQQLREKAAITIQKIIRGFLARRKAYIRKVVLNDRFTCSNCGRVQLPGVYCKGCGRKVPSKYRNMNKQNTSSSSSGGGGGGYGNNDNDSVASRSTRQQSKQGQRPKNTTVNNNMNMNDSSGNHDGSTNMMNVRDPKRLPPKNTSSNPSRNQSNPQQLNYSESGYNDYSDEVRESDARLRIRRIPHVPQSPHSVQQLQSEDQPSYPTHTHQQTTYQNTYTQEYSDGVNYPPMQDNNDDQRRPPVKNKQRQVPPPIDSYYDEDDHQYAYNREEQQQQQIDGNYYNDDDDDGNVGYDRQSHRQQQQQQQQYRSQPFQESPKYMNHTQKPQNNKQHYSNEGNKMYMSQDTLSSQDIQPPIPVIVIDKMNHRSSRIPAATAAATPISTSGPSQVSPKNSHPHRQNPPSYDEYGSYQHNNNYYDNNNNYYQQQSMSSQQNNNQPPMRPDQRNNPPPLRNNNNNNNNNNNEYRGEIRDDNRNGIKYDDNSYRYNIQSNNNRTMNPPTISMSSSSTTSAPSPAVVVDPLAQTLTTQEERNLLAELMQLEMRERINKETLKDLTRKEAKIKPLLYTSPPPLSSETIGAVTTTTTTNINTNTKKALSSMLESQQQPSISIIKKKEMDPNEKIEKLAFGPGAKNFRPPKQEKDLKSKSPRENKIRRISLSSPSVMTVDTDTTKNTPTTTTTTTITTTSDPTNNYDNNHSSNTSNTQENSTMKSPLELVKMMPAPKLINKQYEEVYRDTSYSTQYQLNTTTNTTSTAGAGPSSSSAAAGSQYSSIPMNSQQQKLSKNTQSQMQSSSSPQHTQQQQQQQQQQPAQRRIQPPIFGQDYSTNIQNNGTGNQTNTAVVATPNKRTTASNTPINTITAQTGNSSTIIPSNNNNNNTGNNNKNTQYSNNNSNNLSVVMNKNSMSDNLNPALRQSLQQVSLRTSTMNYRDDDNLSLPPILMRHQLTTTTPMMTTTAAEYHQQSRLSISSAPASNNMMNGTPNNGNGNYYMPPINMTKNTGHSTTTPSSLPQHNKDRAVSSNLPNIHPNTGSNGSNTGGGGGGNNMSVGVTNKRLQQYLQQQTQQQTPVTNNYMSPYQPKLNIPR